MVVFDRTNPLSFEHVDEWMAEIKNYTEEQRTVKLLVGNKSDLSEGVSSDEAQRKAAQLDVPYIETSAKSAYQVEAAFVKLGRLLMQKREVDGLSMDKSFSTRVVIQKDPKDDAACCT